MTEKQIQAVNALSTAIDKFENLEDMYGGELYDAARRAVRSFPSCTPGITRLEKAIEKFENMRDNGYGLQFAASDFVKYNMG